MRLRHLPKSKSYLRGGHEAEEYTPTKICAVHLRSSINRDKLSTGLKGSDITTKSTSKGGSVAEFLGGYRSDRNKNQDTTLAKLNVCSGPGDSIHIEVQFENADPKNPGTQSATLELFSDAAIGVAVRLIELAHEKDRIVLARVQKLHGVETGS